MYVVRPYWAVRTGYDLISDLPHGITFAWGKHPHRGEEGWPRYRRQVRWHWGWPKIIWADRYWRLNEPGMVKGLPIPRGGQYPSPHMMAKAWFRYWPQSWYWPHQFTYSR